MNEGNKSISSYETEDQQARMQASLKRAKDAAANYRELGVWKVKSEGLRQAILTANCLGFRIEIRAGDEDQFFLYAIRVREI